MTLWPAGPLNRALLIAAVAVVLGVGGYFAYDRWFAEDPACAQGVAKRGLRDECVGVTDGGYVFAPSLKQVTDRIKAENDSVAGKSPATIALMIPMISDSQAEQQEYVEQVQGAYLAQYRANHQANGKQPPIRLVLANPGRGYKEWRTVADQLARAAADKKENLRAVAGINISITETEEAVRYLTKDKGIPVVAGPMTADDIKNTATDPHRYPGLARIAPGNTDQADALASYGSDTKPAETLVVEDIREETTTWPACARPSRDWRRARSTPRRPSGRRPTSTTRATSPTTSTRWCRTSAPPTRRPSTSPAARCNYAFSSSS